MFEHVRYALTGVLSVAQSFNFASVLGANLTDEEKRSYFNAIMECRRLEAIAILRHDGESTEHYEDTERFRITESPQITESTEGTEGNGGDSK